MADTMDQNVYALSIQLSLDTTKAFDSFDTFTSRVVEFEKKVQDAAKTALDGFKDLFSTALDGLEDVMASLQTMDTNVTQIGDNFAKASKTVIDIGDNHTQQLKDLKKINKLTDTYVTLHADLSDLMQKQPDYLKDFVKHTEAITAAVNVKNEAHRAQTAEVIAGTEAIGDMEGRVGGVRDKVDKGTQSWRNMKMAIFNAISMIKEADKVAEAFVTTNYRGYGSQQALAQGVRNLTLEYGVFGDQAFEAMKHLMDLKTPQRELIKYAEVVAKANRFTGIAIEPLARYTAQMRQLSRGAVDVEKQLLWSSEAMRKMGLNTQDTTKLLDMGGMSAMRLQTLFGGTAESVDTFNKITASLMGVAKSMGMNTDVATDFTKRLSENAALYQLTAGLVGDVTLNENNLAKAQVALGQNIIDQGYDIEELTKQYRAQGRSGAEAMAALDNYAQSLGLANAEQAAMLTKMAKMAKAQGIVINTTADLERLMKMNAGATDAWTESMNTFTAQLRSLTDWLSAAGKSLLQLAADALIPVLKIVNSFARAIGGAIVQFQDWIAAKRAASPVWDNVINVLQQISGWVIAIGVAMVTVMPIIGSFALMFSGSLSAAIAGFFTTLGTSLRAFGTAIAGVMPQLLMLSVAMLLVSGSVYLLVQSILPLAALPWYIVAGGMVAVALSIALIGGALFALGMVFPVAQAGALVLLTIAGAFALVAVGIAVVVASMSMLIDSFTRLASSITGELIKSLPAFGFALFQLGAWGLGASLGLTALGISLSVLSVGLTLAFVGMTAFGLGVAVVGFGMSVLGDQLPKVEQLFGVLASGNVLRATLNMTLFGVAIVGLGWAMYPVLPAFVIMTAAMTAIALAAYATTSSVSGLGATFASLEPDKITRITELITKLGTVSGTSSKNIVMLSTSLAGTGTSLGLIGDGLSKFTPVALELMPALAVGLNKMGEISTESSDRLQKLGTGVKDLGIGLGGVRDGIRGFTDDIVRMFPAVQDGIRLLGNISEAESTKLGKLSTGIKGLGEGLSGVATSVDVISKMEGNIASFFLTMFDGLRLLSNISAVESERLGKLSAGIKDVGGGFTDIANAIATLSKVQDNVDKSFVSLTDGLRILGNISEAESTRIGKLGTAVKNVGTGFSDIANGVKLFSKEVTDNLDNVNLTLVQLAAVGNADLQSLTKLTGALPKLGEGFKVVAESLTAISTAVGTGISDKIKDLNKTLMAFDVKMLIESFAALRDATQLSLGDFGKNAMNGITSIELFSARLATVSKDMMRAVLAFKTPADMLKSVIENLLVAIDKFGDAKFDQDLGRMTTTLDTYVKTIDALANRIEHAVAARDKPAGQPVLPEVKVAEINPVPIVNQNVGGAAEVDELVEATKENTDTLKEILEVVANGIDKETLLGILSLLQDNLPKIADNDSGGGMRPAMGGW